MDEETLWCTRGEHEWQRPIQCGPKPRYCPEHRRVVVQENSVRASAKWRERNPERHKRALRDYAQRRLAGEPDWRKEEMLRHRYGLTTEEARILIEQRPEICQLCGGVCHDGRINYDHCHETNVHRGWLCTSCNRGLGYFRDDPELLRAAANYLEISRGM